MKIEIDPDIAEFITVMCEDIERDEGIPTEIAHTGMINGLLDKAIEQKLIELKIKQLAKEN